MKVVALNAWKRSGKDCLADHMVANYGATRVSFADPLKDMVSEEFGIPRANFDDPSLKEATILSMPVEPKDKFSRNLCEFMFKEFRTARGSTPEFFVIESGTMVSESLDAEICEQLYWTPRALAILKGSTNRTVRSDYWVSKAIKAAEERGGLIVISDMRYKSEMAQLREAFGNDLITMRIERFDTSPSQDPSERDCDNATFDFTIQNKGSLASLYNDFDAIMAHFQRDILRHSL